MKRIDALVKLRDMIESAHTTVEDAEWDVGIAP